MHVYRAEWRVDKKRGRRFAVVAIVALLMALLLATPAIAAEYEYIGQFGTYGSGDGQFSGPVGVGVNPTTGDVYVIDAFTNRLQVFDATGQFKFAFGTVLTNAQGLAVSPTNGDVYVADHFGSCVQVFDANGNFKTRWGSFGMGDGQFSNGPMGVAVSPSSGDVYAGADMGTNRIQIFGSDGLFKGKFGSQGSGDGQFNNAPAGLGISPSNGDVYVTGYFENRVQFFDAAGQFKSKWGSLGSADGQFAWAAGLAVSPINGDVFVADTGNSRIQVFDAAGQFKGKFGSYGSGNGQFNYPWACAIAPTSGNVYVADMDNHRIQIFKPVSTSTPPEITGLKLPTAPVPVNTDVTGIASFNDSGVNEPWSCEFTWGDGSKSNGTMDVTPDPKTGTATHKYTTPGVYQVGAKVSDGVDEDSEQSSQYIVVYDPNGSFVTGGGSIDSPAGAYAPDTSLSGKATFGFVSKYTRGAAAGNTEFQFHAASMTFKSTSYDWLVVAGARAQYKGWGALNDGTECGFILTAVDGEVTGGGGVDKFRIKIWNRSTGTTIYDNQTGSTDGDELGSSTAITGGSIVVHKR